MGDRGNIAVIQSEDKQEQVWFYGHWSGWRMPAVLQHAIREGKCRWQDPTYFARIVFCRLLPPEKPQYYETTSGKVPADFNHKVKSETVVTHTPGPWRVVKRSNQLGIRSIVVDTGHLSGGVWHPMAGFSPEYEPNARLIAAAPDLLEACKRALPWIGKMIADGTHLNAVAPNDCVGAMDQLDAAIRKAEGL